MVCLTSCVFRSIRFSGFARPHSLGCGARENYTRASRAGARARGALHGTHTSRGIIEVWAVSGAPVPDRPGRWGRRDALDRDARPGAPITVQGRL